MRKFLFFILIIVTTAGARAAILSQTLCSPFGDATGDVICTVGSLGIDGFNASCYHPKLKRRIAVHIVPVCSTGYGDASSWYAENLPTSTRLQMGKYCWCQQTEPTFGAYVYADEMADGPTCVNGCAALCADKFMNTLLIRSRILAAFLDF